MKIRRSILILVALVVLCTAVFSQTPAAIEREFSGYLDNISKYGSYGGGYDETLSNKYNGLLRQKLDEYGKRLDVLKYGFAKLKDKLYVATSRDGRFRIYSWDTETGGTMHDFENVFQYQARNGSVHTWRQKPVEGGAGAFFTDIFRVDASDGPIYLGISTFIGSTSLAGQTISTFKIDRTRLNADPKVIKTGSGLKNSLSFSYDFFSVVDHPERPVKLFYFDASKKSFRFPIVIEDKKTPQGRVTDRFITYRFDGKEFVKVS